MRSDDDANQSQAVGCVDVDAFSVIVPPGVNQSCHTNSGNVEIVPEIRRSHQLRALIFICCGIFSALSIWFVASAVLTPLKQDWDISNAEGSFLTSMVNIGFCVGCLVSASTSLTDLVRPPLLILIGCIGAAISNMLVVFFPGFFGALIVRFCVGVCLSLVYPPGTKLLCTWFSSQHRGAAIGVMFGAFCLGSASPQFLSGVASDNWQTLIVFTSGIAALSGVLVFLFVPVGPFSFPSSEFDARQCMNVLSNRNIVLVIIAYCGHMWELFCVWAWIPLFLENSWQMQAKRCPPVAFAIIAMGGPGSWAGGILGDRIGRVRIAAISLATSGASIATLGILSDEGHEGFRIFIGLVWGFAALADSPNYSALLTNYAEQHYVGTAVTVQLFFGYMITVLALWIVPAIATVISWRWSMAMLAVGPIVGLSALYSLGKREARK